MADKKNLLEIISIIVAILVLIVIFLGYQSEKMENQPIFDFDVHLFGEDDENIGYAEDQLIVSNVGQTVRQFNCEALIFLQIVYDKDKGLLGSALIPIKGYYLPDDNPTDNYSGKLCTFSYYYYQREDEGNYKEIKKAINSFQDFAQKNNSSANIFILRFVKIGYTDIYESTHKEMYFIDPFGDRTHKLTDEQEEQISEYYDSFSSSEILSISKLEPDLLYEKWLQNVDSSEKIMRILNQAECY